MSSPPETTNENQKACRIKSLDDFPDQSQFVTRTEYPALRIPVQQTADLRRRLKKVLLHLPKLKNVYPDENNPNFRLLVLAGPDSLKNPCVADLLQEQDNITATTQIIETDYEYLNTEQVLRRILPKEEVLEVPTAYETVGQLLHVNLREECLPYQYWIGKVLMDKHQPRIKTVVNKLGTIDNVYRTFGMHVIAGNQDPGWSIVQVKEEKCTFELDFAKVYWNSRLAGEHKRLVQYLQAQAKQGQSKALVVADVMAGVGPFAVPLTAKATRNDQAPIQVHANDLNPVSFDYLQRNAKRNRCEQLTCSNIDGRAFIHEQMERHSKQPIDHYIMNLPASAPEFLDAFRGYPLGTNDINDQSQNNDNNDKNKTVLPFIHVYCFAPKTAERENFYQCAVDRCAQSLGCPIDDDKFQIHVVRDVSPSKNMICVSFGLPEAVTKLPRIVLDSTLQETGEEEEEEEASQTRKKSITDENDNDRTSKRAKTESVS